MKIAVAQTKPFKGHIPKNIEVHVALINLAIANGADAVFFPELSITGYERELAKDMATTIEDARFDIFQELSDNNNITIAIGCPIKKDTGNHIGMVIFQPEKNREMYAKRFLYPDEMPYFIEGEKQVLLTQNEFRIAPAICYESSLTEHWESVHQIGADIYAVSVAKTKEGMEKSFRLLPEAAKKYGWNIVLSNSVGYQDDFLGVGQSSAWDKTGELLGSLNEVDEGLLILETKTKQISQISMH
jgi:predicted amidohydrolase